MAPAAMARAIVASSAGSSSIPHQSSVLQSILAGRPLLGPFRRPRSRARGRGKQPSPRARRQTPPLASAVMRWGRTILVAGAGGEVRKKTVAATYGHRHLLSVSFSLSLSLGHDELFFATVDDICAGSVLPFPVVFPGVVNPFFCTPFIASKAFDIPTYDFDLTPFLGREAGNGRRHRAIVASSAAAGPRFPISLLLSRRFSQAGSSLAPFRGIVRERGGEHSPRVHAAAMGFPMVFCPSLRKVFSSKRGPATRCTPFNNSDTWAIGREREMQDEGMTFHSPICFGPQATRQTASAEKKGKKNKPLAIIRKFLKRKSESTSPIILLQHTNAEEAQIPAGSSQKTASVTGPVDPCVGQFTALMDTENIDRETEEKSPLTVSSPHARRTVACEVKEGNHESMTAGHEGTCAPDRETEEKSPLTVSSPHTRRTVACEVKEGNHELMTAGHEGTCAPDILSVIPRLEEEKDKKTENYLPGDSLVGTCSIVTGTGKTRVRVTLKMLMAMEDLEKTICGRKEKETEVSARLDKDRDEELSNSPCNYSPVGNQGTVGSTGKARNRKSRVTLEVLVQEETTGEGETEFGVRDCVSGPVKPSSGSTFFAHPYPLFPPSPRPLSSSSPSSPSMYSEGIHLKDSPAENARVSLEAAQELGRSTPFTSILLKDTGAEEAQVPAEMSQDYSESSLSGPSCSLSSCIPSSLSLMSLSLCLLERSLSLSSLSFSLSRGPLDAEAAEMAALEVSKAADKAEEAAKAAREAANEAMAVEAAVEWEAKKAAREESTKELTAGVTAKVKATDEMAAVPLCQKRLGGSSKRVVGPIFF